ncbi:SNF2-related protein [Mycoplasma sp. HF14]
MKMTKTLYDYQKNGVIQALENKRFLLALDMGLGKTFTALYYLHILKNKLNEQTPTLIIVDSKKVDDWYTESLFFKFNNIATVKSSKDFEQVKNLENYIFIISYRVLTNLLKEKKLDLTQPHNLIVDEAQALKNVKSLISKQMLKYDPYYNRVLLLSGDPLSNGYENLFVLMKLLHLFEPKMKYDDFLEQYTKHYTLAKKLGWGYTSQIKIVTGYKNEDKLIELLHQRSYFLKSEDAIQLPKRQQEVVVVETCSEYYQLNKERVFDFNQPTEYLADNSISLLHGLRQLASGVIQTKTGQFKLVSWNKLKALAEIIKTTNENITVFYNYRSELAYIESVLNELEIPVFKINGEENELQEARQHQGRCVVLIQFQSGARGIDGLQDISKLQVYFSPPLSGELFKQSIKRIHRIGQKEDCKYIFIVAGNSIENDIYTTLKKSENYTLKIFEQNYFNKGD